VEIRKYTWWHECPKCKNVWKNAVGFFRFDGVPKERQCPSCKYKFFYREDVPPYLPEEDEIIINMDDDVGDINPLIALRREGE